MKLGWIFLVGAAAVAISGCGKEAASTTGESGGGATTTGTLEVAAFQGGYGIDLYQKFGKEYGEKAKLEVKVDGSPDVWTKLQPRFVTGDVPDLVFPGWGFDHWKAAYEGQLVDLTSALGEDNWRDRFIPSILKLGEYEGKQYIMPYFVSVTGWWYDPAVFAKNGWTPPATFEELLVLCEKIKAKGIAPITFQGQYPDYMLDGFLAPWIISNGGNQALDDCQNMKPGAWKSPAVLAAAGMIAQLRDNGYFQKGATGMNHTQSQTEFVNGRAAMIPCGSWLYSEMLSTAPKGSEMAFLHVPMLAGGVGDKSAVGIKIEPWMVPAKAKNVKGGIELFKYMTQPEQVNEFATEKGALMALKGVDVSKLPKANQMAADALAKSTAIWSAEYRSWYKDFNKELEGAMASLLSGDLTAVAFCERVEAKAEETRNDPDIVKRTYSR